MTSHAFYTTGSYFDPSRIRLLPRGNMVLVMDRVSGRWVLLPEEQRGLVELLGAARPESLPAPLCNVVEELRENLTKQGVGVAGQAQDFSDLTTVIIKLTNACNLACAYCYDFEKSEKAVRIEADLALRSLRAGGPAHSRTLIWHAWRPPP